MIWRAAGRLIVIPVAFLLAAVAAAFVLVQIGLERITVFMHGKEAGAETLDSLFEVLSQGLLYASGLTIVPALAVILVGEIARIRSWLYYTLGGGLAVGALPLMVHLGEAGAAAWPAATVWQILATAGFAGGFVYWLIAGRSA